MTPDAVATALVQRWRSLAPREQTLVRMAAALVALALIWWLGVAPALRVLRQAESQQQSLDTQLQQMQRLAAEAQALRARPALAHDEARRALEASVRQGLGPNASMSVTGERATVTLRNVPATALAQWLTLARVNARALPVEARLVRGAQTATDVGATWDGALVLPLPPR